MKNFNSGELLLKSVQGHGRDIIAQPYTKIDTALYQAPYEVLSKRNKKIFTLLVFGVIWAGLFFGLLNVQWFAGEAFAAYEEMTTEEFYYEGTQEECQASGFPEGCEIRNFNGGIWWAMLAVFIFSIAAAPIAVAMTAMTYRNKDVSDDWIGQTYGLLAGIPMAIIWALLWLICLPFTWGLLPWGEWSVNWWKIFPFGFGLIWMGGLPLVITVINFFKKLASPEYNHDLVHGGMPLANEDSEGDEDSSSPSAEQTVPDVANVIANRASFTGAEIPQKPSGGRGIAAFLAICTLIPGIVLLIIGGVMSGQFVEGEGSSNYTLEIIDEDSLGDQGFIIFIQGTPGDFNGNGMHDYCEHVMVNANHSGAWMSDPWTGWSSYNEPDETRQVFEVEISHEGSGCDAQHWPKEKWVNEVQLVKLGRACYGCMAGNTTITAEYANDIFHTNPPGMWIQDGEKINESTVLTIIGGILAGIGAVTIITIIAVKISKSKAAAMQDSEGVKQSIEIIESNPGHPVRFRINDPPKGRDAWVGIYPPSADDQHHGGRWSWLRDIDVNNATLPGQTAGKWSIRVFKDGGYKLQHRVDFEISNSPQQPASLTSSNQIVNGKVVIKSVHGKYLSAQPDGRAEWNRDRADVWEYFHLEKRQGGKIALKGAHGRYVSAQPDGSVQINRGSAPPGGWEEFTVEQHFIQPVGRGGYDVIRLKSSQGKYLSAQPDGRVEWNRDHAVDGSWEDIDMEYVGNATITTAKFTYTIDEGIDFSFTAPKLPDDAWIGIVPVAIPHGDEAVNDSHDISYAHLGGRTKGDITLPNPGLGTWTLRLHDTDNNGRELTHVVFEVVSSLGSSGNSHKGRTCEINILEARAGKPIRFNVNNRPSGNEAWFGLYPVHATDQEHGEQHQNWMYFRDVGQNELSLPAKSAGRWSIRVFSDGGYNQIGRLDFDITGAHGNAAQLHPADGHYKLASEELSWNEHNDRALAMGGHLVSITSAEENELVARIAGGRTVWIGGMRKGSGNGPGAEHWCWCDGQPWIYANWARGEPNNYGGNENRIQLVIEKGVKNKLWNDIVESWRGPAVYQFPKEKSIQSAKKIQSALKKSSGKEKPNFWDSVN